MRLFVMTAAAAGLGLSTVMLATGALAVQDTPFNINGVEAVCTGVGSAKDDPRWKAYPIKIVLATSGGANLANAHVSLSQGRQGDCGPGLRCALDSVPPRLRQLHATATLIGGSGDVADGEFHRAGVRPEGSDHQFPGAVGPALGGVE